MEIKQKLIPKSNTKTRPGIAMNPRYITVHSTANTSKGATALAHANLQFKGNTRTASWHFTVDQNEIYQSIPTNETAWHAGDGRGPGNMQSIGIELCVNSDGNFTKTKANAIWLIGYLMDKHNIPITHVVPHKHWSGKDCPHEILPYWSQFIAMITANPTPAATTTVKPDMYDLNYLKGDSFVGIISSAYHDKVLDKLQWAMDARAGCVLLTSRNFDLRELQAALNKMYPEK